jgi:hypothetical protein
MDKKNMYWWSGIIVFLIVLVAILVVDSQKQIKLLNTCKSLRIRPLSEKFFNWEGILELNNKGEYQPKCI